MKRLLFFSIAAILFLLAGCGERTPEGCVNKAMVKAERGDWKGVERLTSRAVALAPEHFNALVLRAVACDKLGMNDMALDSARRAAELNPDSFAAAYTLGRLYAADPKRCGEAEQILRRARQMRPEHTGTLILLCNAAAESNSRHLLTYLRLLERDKNFAGRTVLRNQFGVAFLRCNESASARKEFIHTFEHGRNDPVILLNTAIFFDHYDRQSRNSKAVAKSLYTLYLRNTAAKADAFAASRSKVGARVKEMR